MNFTLITVFIAVSCLTIVSSMPLEDIYKNLERKQNEIKMKEMMDFIAKNLPEGIEAPIPSIAEYETFKTDKMNNFVKDGSGHLQFRQFRRANLGNLLARHQAGI